MTSRPSLLREQPLALQHVHQAGNRPHVGDDQLGNGDGLFEVEFSAMQRITLQTGVFNHLLIGCVHKLFCDLKTQFLNGCPTQAV